MLSLLFLLILTTFVPSNGSALQPNILFFLADDLGFNDIGYHNPNILTPNIDQLAKSGNFCLVRGISLV